MTDLILALISLGLLGGWLYREKCNSDERKALYDRLQAGTIRDYQAFKTPEDAPKPRAKKIELPVKIQPEPAEVAVMPPMGEVQASVGRLMS